MIKWNATLEEMKQIDEIVLKAIREGIASKTQVRLLKMDLEAAHCNGMPLDFDQLLEFPLADFAHDVVGIHNHIDRDTGKLLDCFVPRCKKIEKPTTEVAD